MSYIEVFLTFDTAVVVTDYPLLYYLKNPYFEISVFVTSLLFCDVMQRSVDW
jgi:hypothetical protein